MGRGVPSTSTVRNGTRAMEFSDKDLDQITNRRNAFVHSYGALEIAEDVRYLLNEMYEYRKKERDQGFVSEEDLGIIQAFKHISTRDHKHDAAICWQCKHAEETVKKVRDGEDE